MDKLMTFLYGILVGVDSIYIESVKMNKENEKKTTYKEVA